MRSQEKRKMAISWLDVELLVRGRQQPMVIRSVWRQDSDNVQNNSIILLF